MLCTVCFCRPHTHHLGDNEHTILHKLYAPLLFAGHQFASVGLAPCNINTAAAAIGTKFAITFSVYDDALPPLQASVTRTVLITSPCLAGGLLSMIALASTSWAAGPTADPYPLAECCTRQHAFAYLLLGMSTRYASVSKNKYTSNHKQKSVQNCVTINLCAGQYLCNGACYSVSCAIVALLKSGPAPKLALSTEAKAVAGSATSLTLPYGLPVAFTLLPCTASGDKAAPRCHTCCLGALCLVQGQVC